MTVMVTGHRQLTPEGWTDNPWPDNNPIIQEFHHNIKQQMLIFCQQMFDIGETEFMSGMALGADQLFAEAVIHMKRANFPVTLVSVLPFEGQESTWPESCKVRYRNILAFADKKEIVSPGGYSPDKMRIRNYWMVDNSDIVLAVWDGTSKYSGTRHCVGYARKSKKVIVLLDPRTLIMRALPE